MLADVHVLEQLPTYALDCLEPEEAVTVAQHLAVCPACAAELSAYQSVTTQLALAVPTAAPSPHLKERLMARLHPPAPSVLPPQKNRGGLLWPV
jgi:anti-sigma factor RsiW